MRAYWQRKEAVKEVRQDQIWAENYDDGDGDFREGETSPGVEKSLR